MCGEGLSQLALHPCPDCQERPGVRDQEMRGTPSVRDKAGQVWAFGRKGRGNTRNLAFGGSQVQPCLLPLRLPAGLAETSLGVNNTLGTPSPRLPPEDAWF